MKIKSLTASFGKLKNDTLTFHDGLNVIYAPNESGKSTWCAFIRAMLYGINSSERARNGYIPDKQRYAPWSGAPMEGTMQLETANCDITITRTSKNSNAPMREFSAVYTGTNREVDGLTAANAGEELTGVTAGVFRRTAFVEQGTISVSGSAELEKRIAAIVSSGEEQTSFTDADTQLRGWQRKRRFNRHGALPELEAKMDTVERALERMETYSTDVAELEDKLAHARSECKVLETAMTESRKVQRRNALTRMTEGRTEIDAKNKAHDSAVLKLSEARDALRGGPFGAEELDVVVNKANSDVEEYHSLTDALNAGYTIYSVLAIVCFIMSVLAASIYIQNPMIFAGISAGLFLVAGVVLFVVYSKIKSNSVNAEKRQGAILASYHAAEIGEINGLLETHKELWDEVHAAAAREAETRIACEDALLRQQRIEDRVLGDLDFVDGDSEAAKLSRQLAEARSKMVAISEEIASLNGRLSVFGDPMALKSELTVMEDRHDRLASEYEAIEMALQVMAEADDEIQRRFSPELGAKASEYMAQMTGGRYKKVLIDRDFSAMTRTDVDPVARKSEYLSAGTLDLMYLAVRLAVCELALPNGEPCPLIIDDALVNLDDTRTRQVMELLRDIAKTRQVILFSCRKPEASK